MQDFSLLKDFGPLGLAVFGLYLMGKELIQVVKSKTNGGMGISNQLLNHKLLDILIDLKTETELQTQLLQRLVDKE